MENNIKESIEKYDSKKIYESINMFHEQCTHAWENAHTKPVGNVIKNVLVIGMGGSALGAYIIQSLNILNVPLSVSHEYFVPEWVSDETLVLAMSYSGGTEETLSATESALGKGATVVGITCAPTTPSFGHPSSGRRGENLADILEEKKCQVYTIDTSKNPCGQPRFGVGSMMAVMLKVFMTNELTTITEKDIQETFNELELWEKSFEETNRINQIYSRAEMVKDNILIYVYAEHLTNIGRFARNQTNETAKTLALTHEIPELNHHLMEGLEYPQENKKLLHFFFHESDLYADKIKKRFHITKDVLDKQNIAHTTTHMEGQTKLAQTFIAMLRSMYFAFSLALIHQKDPSDIPWVNYFKEQLGK